jgi:hypothetical protein
MEWNLVEIKDTPSQKVENGNEVQCHGNTVSHSGGS